MKTRWLLAIPLVLATTVAPARAASIRDNAGMFDPRAVQEAKAELTQVESKYGLPVTIETIPSLDGRGIDAVLEEHARALGADGIYVLISKEDKKIEAMRSGAFAAAFPTARLETIRQAIRAQFNKRDFSGGLLAAVQAIRSEAAAAQAEHGSLRQGRQPRRNAIPSAVPARGRPGAGRGTFGIGTLLAIGLIIIAVLIGIRLLGALFGAGRGAYGPGRMGGPGYGGPGYGGGGGFLSGLFGGLGGAIAGNWLYDQFSGRHNHGGYTENTSYGSPDADTGTAPDNADWGGGSGGTSWDDAGGGGGGDWGGGGGGGDWGGGGGGDGGGW